MNNMAAIFSSQHPKLAEAVLIGTDVDALRRQAEGFRLAMVGAENADRHPIKILWAKDVPAWHGKREVRPARRVKDDLTAWEWVNGF